MDVSRRPINVLVIDDHADTVSVFVRLLNRMGYSATGATSMSQARAICYQSDRKFDFAIADIGLPDGDGRDLLVELAPQCMTRGIIVSGYISDRDRAETAARGIGVFLAKPITQKALQDAIHKLMESPTAALPPDYGDASGASSYASLQ